MARDGRSQPPGLGLPCSMGKSDPPVQPMQHSVSSIWTDQLGFGFRVGHPVADKRMERRSERQRERERDVGASSLSDGIFKVMHQSRPSASRLSLAVSSSSSSHASSSSPSCAIPAPCLR
ncbi:hypothetical protein TEQG_02945 [Trichophyton equinum CBS 127.97]|uniref:Uncharacterized protein n=1 Tax=Trichophyton equinum (strain ATCC MYA-4606 / CBS 127.97) TaxID=559882 RepID=F2PPU4_TRIEC|nr:hypothetical protein TEQG_02945 [Trichophyton equinum CBS 127.97]